MDDESQRAPFFLYVTLGDAILVACFSTHLHWQSVSGELIILCVSWVPPNAEFILRSEVRWNFWLRGFILLSIFRKYCSG